ncbi:MAG TPA: hypothetical protein VHV08_05220 [Pirellulales bacterium]|nr:hypothetical protein [Pirellulales bacterium]
MAESSESLVAALPTGNVPAPGSEIAITRALLTFRLSRMARLTQVMTTFVSVVAAYFFYALLVVPLIEPNVEHEVAARTSQEEIDAVRTRDSARKRALTKYFPTGSWELDNPAIWENEQTVLLFKEPHPLPDGQLELRWCTLMRFSKPPAAGEPEGQPIIMRASDGATLKFDEPVVLKNVDLSKRQLVGGRLKGQITIRREPSRPGAADDLTIVTRDMELLEDRAWTPHGVEFALGHSRGSGRELVIHLAGEAGAKPSGIRTSSLRTLELKRDVVMFLDMGDAPGTTGAKGPAKQRDEPPMRITCQGPFEYDFARYAASFHERVDVIRQTIGPADILNCELLTVFFAHDTKSPGAQPPASPAVPAGDNQISNLQVRVIEARGDPVTVRSPARGIYIHCRGFNYFPAPAPAMGTIVGLGPGVMQGDLPKNAAGKYLVEWSREFRFEPDGAQQRASLHGLSSVRIGQMGRIVAKNRVDGMGRTVQEGELFAWLTPVKRPAPLPSNPATQPAAPASDSWQIERLMAQGEVEIDAPQLAGKTGKLEAWIERPTATAAIAPSDETEKPAAQARPRQNPLERFNLAAGSIQMKMVPAGEQMAIADATLERQARLEQTSILRPGQRPLVVQGDRLHVTGANTEATRLTVAGKPGYLEANGLALRGEAIEMEKQANRLWINGPGRMTMPMEQDLDGKPLPRPQVVDITWRGGMNFQNKMATYERNVEVKSQSQYLSTEKLVATLSQPIDFSNSNPTARAKPEDRPQLAHVRTFGPVFLESRQLDERGKQTSFDRLEAFDLQIDRLTGAVDAAGPGQVTHLGYGSPQAAPAGPVVPVAQRPPAIAQKNNDQLNYLNVQFQRSMSGNTSQGRQVTFGGPTKTVYGPVDNWESKLDAERPETVGPQGMVLDARELTIRETPAVTKRDRGSYELIAVGNVSTEGAQFFARGQKATYSQQKDQLILEGDGRSPAEISYESPGGGRRNETLADMIIYAIGLQHLRFSGARSVGVDVLQNKPPKANKKPLPF